jgi:chitinase
MDDNSATLYRRFTALKDKYNGLQAFISIGGWSFTDPGPTRQAFSNMASTAANRQKFISSALSFMDTYGFDGLDLDWVSTVPYWFDSIAQNLISHPGVSRCR